MVKGNTKMSNIKLNPSFTQVCVWPGTVLSPDDFGDFVDFFQKEFGTRVQYLKQINTRADLDTSGYPVPGTGDRNDLFFAVHDEDVVKFAAPRMGLGVRWIEDVLSPINGNTHLYPERVGEYCSWSTT
jgi:hypothetical protein